MPAKKKVTISVRLDPALAKRVKKLAKKADRSVSSLVEYILDDCIEYEEKVMQAIEKGREDIRAGRYMDAEEFFAQLEKEVAQKNARSRHSKRSA